MGIKQDIQTEVSKHLNEGIVWLKTSKSISALLKKAVNRLNQTEVIDDRIKNLKTIKKLKEAYEAFDKLERRYMNETDSIRKNEIKEKFKSTREEFKEIINEINSNRAMKIAIGAATVTSLVIAAEAINTQMSHAKHEQQVAHANHENELIIKAMVDKYNADRNLVVKVADIAKKEGVPVDIALSLVGVESEWDPDAKSYNKKSDSTDIGLCQLNNRFIPEFIQKFWHEDRHFNPLNGADNATVAFRHLHWLHDHTGSWRDAVMAYNAGLDRVENGEAPQSTHRYANAIFASSTYAEHKKTTNRANS